MDDERAQFERSISNLYGFGQLKLDQENIGRARRHYTALEEQTDAFIAANPHLSSLQLQLLDANVRFKAPLYSAFRDLLWARYRKVRAHPDLGELVAACMRLCWWDEFLRPSYHAGEAGPEPATVIRQRSHLMQLEMEMQHLQLEMQ